MRTEIGSRQFSRFAPHGWDTRGETPQARASIPRCEATVATNWRARSLGSASVFMAPSA